MDEASEHSAGSSGEIPSTQDPGSSFERRIRDEFGDLLGTKNDRLIGSTIGGYRLLGVLGEGGFGVVYLAEQTEPVRRKVALKIIKPGMASREVIARFEAERQALAVMKHPSVAKMLDGGVTDEGLPFFVMELVKGDPITAHCDRQKLPLRARLELMIRVCEGVQHAHSKGIIHRDLKPSNILVEYEDARSTPKVIDFGVAKALNQRLTERTLFTQQGRFIGTPEYMSPEQAEMGAQDIDTRSDVYSLGVILYELVTGTRPFDPGTLREAAVHEIHRIIREVEPPKPSTRLLALIDSKDESETATRIASERGEDTQSLSRTLKQDLDWIVMRCLEKDRERRYETANALAAELGRYLDGEPVLAGPPSVRYRLGKFVRRHRTPVAVTGAVALLMVAAVVGMTLLTSWALREQGAAIEAAEAEAEARRQAERREAQLEGLSDFMIGSFFEPVSPIIAGGGDVTVLEALKRSVPLIDSIFEGQDPATGARVHREMGRIFTLMTIFEQGFYHLDRAIGLVESDPDATDLDRAQVYFDLGSHFMDRFDFKPAEVELRRALESLEASDAGDFELEAQILSRLGLTAALQSRFDEAVDLLRRALRIADERLGPQHPESAIIRNHLGRALESRGERDAAIALFEEAIELGRASIGEETSIIAMFVHNLGMATAWAGDPHGGAEILRDNLQLWRRIFEDPHPQLATGLSGLASIEQTLGNIGEALDLYEELVEVELAVYGEGSGRHGQSLRLHASALLSAQRFNEAEAIIRRAIEILRAQPEDTWGATLAAALSLHGQILNGLGRADEAIASSLEAIELYERYYGPDHYFPMTAKSNLAFHFRQLGRLDEAEEVSRSVLEWRRAELAPSHQSVADGELNLGAILIGQGECTEVVGLARHAVEVYAGLFQPEDSRRIYAGAMLAAAEDCAGTADGAERLVDAYMRLEDQNLHDSWRGTDIARWLAELYERRGNERAARHWQSFTEAGG